MADGDEGEEEGGGACRGWGWVPRIWSGPVPVTPPRFSEHTPCPGPTLGEELIHPVSKCC